MYVETALNIVNNAFFRAATGRNDTILTSYVVLPKSAFVAKIPPMAVGFQTFLIPLFTSLLLPLFVSFVSFEKEAQVRCVPLRVFSTAVA